MSGPMKHSYLLFASTAVPLTSFFTPPVLAQTSLSTEPHEIIIAQAPPPVAQPGADDEPTADGQRRRRDGQPRGSGAGSAPGGAPAPTPRRTKSPDRPRPPRGEQPSPQGVPATAPPVAAPPAATPQEGSCEGSRTTPGGGATACLAAPARRQLPREIPERPDQPQRPGAREPRSKSSPGARSPRAARLRPAGSRAAHRTRRSSCSCPGATVRLRPLRPAPTVAPKSPAPVCSGAQRGSGPDTTDAGTARRTSVSLPSPAKSLRRRFQASRFPETCRPAARPPTASPCPRPAPHAGSTDGRFRQPTSPNAVSRISAVCGGSGLRKADAGLSSRSRATGRSCARVIA